MASDAVKPVDSSDAEIDAFVEICDRMSGFDPGIDAEWFDGWLTALAAGPRRIDIDEWLPRAFGDVFERTFADPEDEARARAALLARERVIVGHLDAESLLDVPDDLRLQPLVLIWDDEARRQLVDDGTVGTDEAAQMTTGAVWAEGFLDAIAEFGDDWRRPADADAAAIAACDEMLDHVRALLLAPGSDKLKAHVERWYPGQLPDAEDLLDEACFAIQDLRVWWLDHAPRPATRRVAPAPGRNDPCPCGSGRKYKRCHGAA